MMQGQVWNMQVLVFKEKQIRNLVTVLLVLIYIE